MMLLIPRSSPKARIVSFCFLLRSRPPSAKMLWYKQQETIDFCKQNLVVYFTQVTSVINDLSEIYHEKATVCSLDLELKRVGEPASLLATDNVQDGHEQNNLPDQFQELCLSRVKRFCEQKKNVIIVDSANMLADHLQQLFRLCSIHNYIPITLDDNSMSSLEIMMTQARLSDDLRESCKLSQAEETAASKREIFPYYYGWFLSLEGSRLVRNECFKVVNSWLDIPQFVRDKYLDFPRFLGDLGSIYHAANVLRTEVMHHVTACFVGESKVPWYRSYIIVSKPDEFIGKASVIEVIGWFVTPRTIGVRVKLSEEQLQLWGKNDRISRNPSNVAAKSGPKTGAYVGSTTQRTKHVRIKVTRSNKCPTVTNDVDLQRRSATPRSQSKPKPVLGQTHLSPTYTVGCTAHITIGCREGFSAKQTGNDLTDIALCELERGPVLELNRDCILRNYGAGRWICYKQEPLFVPVIFSRYYRFDRLE